MPKKTLEIIHFLCRSVIEDGKEKRKKNQLAVKRLREANLSADEKALRIELQITQHINKRQLFI